MDYLSCENCLYFDSAICSHYSKKVKIVTDNGDETKMTVLNVEKEWYCKKFEELMPKIAVYELNRELEKTV